MKHPCRHPFRAGARIAILVVAACLVSGVARAEDQPKAASKPNNSNSSRTGLEQTRVINERIAEKWQAEGLTPSTRCDDYTFIRRVSLDIIGRIATPEEITRYFQDAPGTRRSLLVDRLLKSEDYSRNWATIWSVWLLTRSANPTYANQMYLWLEERFVMDDCAWDKMVTELLTATGKNTENGAVNFILAHLGEPSPAREVGREGQFNMVPITSRSTRLFLGLQTQCIQCHDHPFKSEWKQKHFWMTNGFFRQVERKGTPAMNRPDMNAAPELTLVDNPRSNLDGDAPELPGVVYYERRNGVVVQASPTFLLDEAKTRKTPPSNGKRREVLAEYMTKSEQFPKAFVNRMWAHFFGKGMNTPGAFDDFGEDNPITHPELLEYLAREFRAYQLNPRELIRWICNSDAYQLSSIANKTNEKPEAEPFFSRMLLKSMSPEQLFESLMVATQAATAETKDAKHQLRERWLRSLIVNFGDDEGNEETFNGTVVQALILMNGKELNDTISSKEKGLIAQLLKKKGSLQPRQVLDHVFIAVLNRMPTSSEAGELLKRMGSRVPDTNVAAPFEDLMWALINSNEFILNH